MLTESLGFGFCTFVSKVLLSFTFSSHRNSWNVPSGHRSSAILGLLVPTKQWLKPWSYSQLSANFSNEGVDKLYSPQVTFRLGWPTSLILRKEKQTVHIWQKSFETPVLHTPSCPTSQYTQAIENTPIATPHCRDPDVHLVHGRTYRLHREMSTAPCETCSRQPTQQRREQMKSSET